MPEALKAVIVGLGNVAVPHLEAYQSLPDLEVVAGVEPRAGRLAEMAARYGFRPYPDLETMLEKENPDLAVILTSVNTHREVAEKVAERRIHLLCEKPLAIRLEDAQAIVDLEERFGIRVFYGASYRFLPAMQQAKALIGAGTIGEVQLLMEILLGGKGPEGRQVMGFSHYPQGGPGGSGMGLVDHGIHLIDAFPWLAGSPIISVSGRGNISGGPPAPEFMIIQLENGATGHLICNDLTFPSDLPTEGLFSWGAGWNVAGDYLPAASWHDQPGNIRVHGSKGALRIYHYANRLFLTTREGQREIPLPHRVAPFHFATQMQTFINNIRKGEPADVPAIEGYKALKALWEVYRF